MSSAASAGQVPALGGLAAVAARVAHVSAGRGRLNALLRGVVKERRGVHGVGGRRVQHGSARHRHGVRLSHSPPSTGQSATSSCACPSRTPRTRLQSGNICAGQRRQHGQAPPQRHSRGAWRASKVLGSACKPTPPAMGCCLVGLLMSRLGAVEGGERSEVQPRSSEARGRRRREGMLASRLRQATS